MGLLKNTNEYLQKFDKYIKKYSVNTDYDIGTALMLRMLNDGVSDKYSSDEKPELKEYLPTGLTGDDFHTYVLDRVNDMNNIENALIALIEASISLLHTDYLNLKLSESTIDKNKFIELIKNDTTLYPVIEVTTSGDNTIVFEIKRYRTRKMFISKELYDSESWKSILNPHNFIARLNLYDYIFFLNVTETDEEEWIIPNGITVGDKNYNSIKALTKDIDPVTNRILIIVANKKDVTNSVEYSPLASLTEPTKLQILENTSTEDIINQWIVYTKERIKELNRFYQKLLHEIDSLNIVLYPDKIHYVDFYNYRNRKNQTPVKITTEHTYSILSYKLESIKHVRNIITLYNQFLLNCHVFGRALRDMKNPPSGNPIGVMGIRPYGTAYILSYGPIRHTQPAGYEYHSIDDMIEDFELYNSIPGITDSYVLNKYPRCVIMTSGNKHGSYSDNKMEEQEIVNTNISPDVYCFISIIENSNDSLNEYVVTVPNENGELEDFDILAKDLFDEHIRIHPEKLKTESICCYKTANELLKYFNQEEELQSIGADNNYIAGMSALRTMMIDKGKNDPNGRYGLQQYLPVNLNEEEFHDYVLQRIKEMDEIESNLVRLIKANLLLNRSDYLEIKQLEAVTDKKKYIKTLKTRVKNNPKLFIHREGFNTTVFDFGIYGRGKVYINDEIYEKEPRWKEVLEPSRFLVRASIYDYIIIVHGTIMKNGQWAILDGITVNGKNYISINQLIKDLNPIKNKILLMVCNEENIVPDMSEFPTLDYATHRVLMESSQFQLSKHFTTEKLLKEWINYMKNRIKELNKFYQSILDQIDAMDITLYPEKIHYVKYSSTFDTPAFIETKRISSIKDYKTECYKNIRDLIHIYDQFLLNCIIFAKALQKMKSNVTNESVGALFYYREGLPIIMGAASISCTQPIGYEYESLEEAIEDITIHKSIPGIDDTYNPMDYINYILKKSDGTKSFKNIELQKALDFILPDIYQVNGYPKTSDIEIIEEYPKHDDILNFNKFKVFMRDIFNSHNYSFSSDIEQPTEQEISTLISKFNQANGIISDLNVKVSKNIKEFLDTVSYIEEYIHKIISQNIKLICTDINSCSLNVLSVKEKELNEKYYTRFTIMEPDDTIMIDLIPLGLGRIYISKEYYRPINKSEAFKFLLRSNHYNMIIVSNGSFGIYHEKPTWKINPITIDGKQYHNLDEIREYAKQNGINRVALIMNDHSNANATNLIYYDNIDYKFDYDFDLVPIPKILITTNTEFTIKSCISHYLNKIEELNNLEYHLMKYVDQMEQLDSNSSFTSIRFIKTNYTYITKRVDRENEDRDIIKQRKSYYECIENSFKMYRSILYDVIYHLMDRLS